MSDDELRRYLEKHHGMRFGRDEIQRHELNFYLDFIEDAKQKISYIPRDGQTRKSTNDFKWITRGGIEVELKSVNTVAYKAAKRRIHEAVTRASQHKVTKDVFFIDFGTTHVMTDKVRDQLSKYNQRNPSLKIRELWVRSRSGYEQIMLK